MKEADGLRVPIAFGVAAAAFLLMQAFIDWRDPKLSRAPQRGSDDTVGFE